MRDTVARPFIARLADARILAAALVVALVLVLVGQWGLPAAATGGSIASVAPTGATTAGGGTITISGSGFGTETPAVTIGGTAASDVVLIDDATVTATIPAGAPGLADVVVTPVGGDPITLNSGFEYRAPAVIPVFDTIAPASGPVTGGDPVTISGSNLDRVTDIRFGSVWIPSWQFVALGGSGSSITVIAPYGAQGPVDVTLRASGTSDVTKYAAFTYVAPAISAVSPASGASVGGTAITITGSGFGTSGSVSVTIGGVAATNVVRIDSTRITATTPAGPVGAASVVVTVSGASGAPGPITITRTDGFTYAASVWAPTLAAVTPNSGPVSGGQTVTLTGTNFRASNGSLATVTVGGTPATVQSVAGNGKSMTIVVPAHAAGAVDVQVTTIDGRATMRGGYTYSAAPTISAVSPASGIVAGGTPVTITGTGFGTSGVPTVTVGGRAALCVARLSDTTITFVAPSSAITGARDVEVTPATRGGVATLTGGFTYVTASTFPTISAVSPTGGLTSGGTAITITGSGFATGGTPSVLIGGACATAVTVVSDSTITASTPTGVAGARDVVVTSATGTVTAAGAFTYADAPAILSLSPAAGPTTGGASVIVNGRGFGSSGIPVVTIDGVPATNVERLSDTQLRITTPAGSPGAKAVQVTPVGGSTLNKPSAYTYQVPTVTGVSPFAGPTRGGTPVTITGTGFGETGTPAVTFGGVPATSVVRVSSTQLTAVTPAGTAGYVAVTVTPTTGGSSGTKGNAFSYVTDVVTPQISSSIPSRGPAEGGSTVYVTGANFIGTNGQPATVRVGSAAGTSVVVAEDGRSLSFRTPALSPGHYDLTITTNEGSAVLRWAYLVSPPPVVDSCDAVSPRWIGPEAGTTVTVTGEGFGAEGRPSVTVGGTPATVGASSDTSVTFTVAAGDLGYPDIVVRPTTGGSPITVSGCLFRTTDLTITAPTHTIDFGDPSPVFVSTASGLHGDDRLQSVVHVFTGAGYGPTTVVPTNAGVYTVTPANAVLNPGTLSYYQVDYVPATFTIRGLQATIWAEDASKVYGDDDPEFRTTVSGLLDGHTLTGVAFEFTGVEGTEYGPSLTPPVNVGQYRVRPVSATVGGTEGNYQFTYVGADYEITPRPITIGAVPAFKTYGDEDPIFEWSIESGSLAYDDTLPGTLSRDPGEDVGQYDILQGSVGDPNYEITYVSDVLDIQPRSIDVVISDASKQYGDDDPTFEATASGLQFGDVVDGFAQREPGENVGEYEITRGTLSAGPNYVIASVSSGTFTITPRPLEIHIESGAKIYGDADPSFDYVIAIGSLVAGDAIDGAPSRQAGEDAGLYGLGQGTLDAGPNYELTFVPGQFEILPRPIEVTADDQSKQYGDADPSPLAYTVTSGELVGDDALSGELSREVGEDVGEYAIEAGTLGAGANYEVTVVGGSLTITPREITVAAADLSRVYGDTDPELTWSITAGSLVGDDALSGALSREAGEDVGDYAIGRGTLDHPSYDITFESGVLSITPRPITVTAQDSGKEYGESDPVLAATSEGLVFGDELTGALSRETGEDVGDYAILAGAIGAGPNYVIESFQPGTFAVTPRFIELTAQDSTITYGDAVPTGAVDLTSGTLAPGDVLGAATFVVDPADPRDAGSYSVTPSTVAFASGSASNYDVSFVGGTLTIEPREITVTVDDQSKEYGDLDPELTFQASPALVGDDAFTGSLARETGESVGDYAIGRGSLDAGGNYTLTVLDGRLTITPRSITVSADAASKVYGEADPQFSYQITAGSLLPGDELSGALDRVEGEHAGEYAIGRGSLGGGDYEIAFEPAIFTITPKPITVVIDDAGKQYGTDDPEFTANSDGLEPGDALTGAPARVAGESVGSYVIGIGSIDAGSDYEIVSVTEGRFEITRQSIVIRADDATITYGDALPSFGYSIVDGFLVDGDSLDAATVTVVGGGVDVGTYELTVSDAVVSGGASNYDISYESGTLTVDPFGVTVTAVAAQKEYGDDDPALEYTSSGLLGGDEFTGALDRDPGEEVGAHAITLGTLDAGGNYRIDFLGAELTITVRALTITADAQSKVYGDADPELSWQITDGSLLPGDSLTGSLDRESGEDVGELEITRGSLDNPNYDIEFVGSTLTITPRPIEVVVDDAVKEYGDDDPQLTASSTDLVFGDTVSGTPERTAGEAVGDYPIGIGSVDAGPNYSIDSVIPGRFEITPRFVELTADDQAIVYGDAAPANAVTVTAGGFVGGDALGSVDFAVDGDLSVGEYSITPSNAVLSTGLASNYEFAYVAGTLTVDPLAVTVTAQPASKTYGDADPDLEFSVEPELVEGDSFTGSLTRGAGESVGLYSIERGTLDAGGNYTIDFVPADLEISPRGIQVTADAAVKTFGDADPVFGWSITGGSLVGSDSLSGGLDRESGEGAGQYALTLGTLGNPDYEIDFVSADLTVLPRPITVVIEDADKTYGDADPSFTASSPDLIGGDALTGTPERDAGEDVGDYPIGLGSVSAGADYEIVSVDEGTLSIEPRSITVSADDASSTFGSELPELTWTLVGGSLAAGDEITSVQLTTVPASPTDAGEYPVLAEVTAISGGGIGNYTVDSVEGTLTIDPLEVVVTATPAAKIYGQDDPVFHFTTEPSLGGAVFGALSRETGEHAGEYAMTLGSLDAGDNYSLTLVSAGLTIVPRPIEVTADAATKVYGDDDPALSWTITSGALVGEDELDGALSRQSGEDVGEYAITIGSLDSADYEIEFVPADLTITPRPITVTAVDAGKEYGADDPALTATSTGLIGDDELSGAPERGAGESVDDYPISRGTVSAGSNYEITSFEPGVFRISPRAIEITADDATVVYGDADPALTFEITSGSLVGDDEVSGSLEREPGADAGQYDILQGDLAVSDDYELTFVPGVLTIDPRVIGITADSVTKAYGDADPTPLTFTVTSGELADGDEVAGSLEREPGESVGEYDILPGSLDAGSNYTFTVEGGTLTITPRAITVAADNTTAVYGDSDPEFTWSVVAGDLVGDDELVGSLEREAGSDVGDYAIGLGSLGNPDYEIEFTPGVHVITPRPVTVVGDDVDIVYGASDPILTATATGLLPGDELAGAPTREPGDDVGEYAVLQGTLSVGSNYELTAFTPGVFAIAPRELEVTVDDAEKLFGQTDPAFTARVTSGALVGDDLLSGTPEREPGENVGEYEIGGGTVTAGSNYALTVRPGTLRIAPAPLAIAVGSGYTGFGDAAPDFSLDASGLAPGDALSAWTMLFDGSPAVPTMPGTYAVGLELGSTALGAASNYDVEVATGLWIIDGPTAVIVDPDTGLTTGGLPFEIRGSGFGFEAPVVTFGGVPATDVALLDSGTIIGLTPEHPVGLVTVGVETAAGSVELVDAYTYVEPVPGPSVASIEPGRGPEDGGTQFTITGDHLVGTDGEPAVVLIDGRVATDVTVAEDGLSLTAVSPAGTPGPRDVDVLTADGWVTFFDGFEYVAGPVGDVTGTLWLDLDGDEVRDDGEPALPGVTVFLVPTTAPVSAPWPAAAILLTTVTDSQGRYSFAAVPHGSWKAGLEGPGGLTLAGGIPGEPSLLTVEVDGPDAVADFPLIGHAMLAGVVAYSDGRPAPGATVVLRWAGPDGQFDTDDDVVITVIAEADGSFAVPGLPGGDWIIGGSSAGGEQITEHRVEVGVDEQLDGLPLLIEVSDVNTPSALAATGLGLGHVALTAVLLLLLGAMLIGRPRRQLP